MTGAFGAHGRIVNHRYEAVGEERGDSSPPLKTKAAQPRSFFFECTKAVGERKVIELVRRLCRDVYDAGRSARAPLAKSSALR